MLCKCVESVAQMNSVMLFSNLQCLKAEEKTPAMSEDQVLTWPKNRYSQDIHEINPQFDHNISHDIDLGWTSTQPAVSARRQLALQIEVDTPSGFSIPVVLATNGRNKYAPLLANPVLPTFFSNFKHMSGWKKKSWQILFRRQPTHSWFIRGCEKGT